MGSFGTLMINGVNLDRRIFEAHHKAMPVFRSPKAERTYVSPFLRKHGTITFRTKTKRREPVLLLD
jgi:hypothetical protein